MPCTRCSHVDERTPTHIQYIGIGVRQKIFSFGPNCSSDAVRLHYTGYYLDRSYSVISVNANILLMDRI